MNKISTILVIILLVTSCKSKKSVTNTSDLKRLSSKKIINNYYENTFDQNTIDAKIRARYRDSKSSMSLVIKLRMEKDKTIWLSATKLGFPLAKVKITPDRVSYYEKLQRVYFDGDFSLLSKWLGTELNFEEVQNLLIGQSLLNLEDGRYDSQIRNNMYELTPKGNNKAFNLLFLFNPSNFKLNSQEISHVEKEQVLTVSYPKYELSNGENFPSEIDIKVRDEKKLTHVNLDYRSVEFNKKLTFPFTIPKGYKEIRLK
jgi:hypothetical protein